MRLAQGQFGWVDLSTTDVPAAKDFYAAFFGWQYEDVPTPIGLDYTMCRVDGQLVAGIGPMPPVMADAGVPSTWNSYVIVKDVDDVAAAAVEHGGAVVMPAMDIMTSGRMAMIAGPDSAVLGLWQPIEHQGAELFDAPGAVTWNELQSRSLEPSMTFLADVLGWRWERASGEMDYHLCHVDALEGDTSNGGAMNMPDGVPPEAPSMWVVYFAVADCDASAAQVSELGGELFLPPMEMGPNRFAGAADPTGGMFFFGSFHEPA
jgi:predicted enzyme related to lactoylglutathione lyase